MLWPFKAKVWLSLLFLNLFTGGWGGFSNIQIPDFPNFWKNAPASDSLTPTPKTVPAEITPEKFLYPPAQVFSFLRENKKTILTLLGILVSLWLLLLAVWTWLYSRLKMVLIQCLLTKTFSLRRYWKETQALGESLFRFNFVALVLLAVPLLTGPALVVRGFLKHTLVLKEHGLFLVLGGLALLGYLLVFVFVMSVVNRFLPIYMGVTGQRGREAIRYVFSLGAKKMMHGLGFVLLYTLLAIGTGIAMSIILIMIIATMAILFGFASLLGALLVKFLAVPKFLVISIGILLALPCAAGVFVLMAVPAETFKNFVGLKLIEEHFKNP
ncbi:MAG: hypothetical protein KCHDKBKB_01775 [Elusimicrobia bacterium]|nr:hypothetical protein [Elusimicrobiota bacterium]